MGEALAGVGRTIKGAASMIPQLWEYNKTLPGGIAQGVAQDLWKGITQSGEASQKAKESGEGAVGQTLAAAENYPVIGGMVKKAEEAGPGYAKFKPQTLGAATEALSTFEGPQLAAKGLEVANKVIPSLPRAGAAIGQIKQVFGDKPVVGDLKSFSLARDLVEKWDRQGVSVPKPLRQYVENVTTADGANSVFKRAAAGEPEAQALADQFQAKGITPQLVSFNMIHEAREALNDLKYDKTINPKQAAQIGQISKLATDELNATAEAHGFGEDWRKFENEYHKGAQLVRAGNKAGPVVGGLAGAVAGKYLSPELSAIGLPEQLQSFAPLIGEGVGSLVGAKAGKGVIGSMVRSVVERNAGPPRLRSLPPSPEAHLRTLLDAKEGLISPGEADRRITRNGGRVKVKPIPQPTE